MKKFLLKFGTIIVLSLSIVFGSAITPQSQPTLLTESAYADEDDLLLTLNPDSTDISTDAPENTDATEDINSDTTGNDASTESENDATNNTQENSNVCQGEAGSISWALCPLLNAASKLVDGIYGLINNILVIQPLSTDHDSAIYKVWQKACEITNIIFAIFILIVIYSQITGFGVNNYGIKRVLPRIIIAVIMVNLSFFITSLLVDVSNIVGSGLVDFFASIQSDIQASTSDPFYNISWGQLFGAFAGGATLGFIAIQSMGGIGTAFWMLVIALLGALISVVVGLVTIGLRQGVVLVLIMISPLAFVAYLLPNTEKWFEKWKAILAQMLFFYPMFSFLYGASKLAGWAIISTADQNPIFVLLGCAVQVMPLFLSVSLLKMSGTVLGGINSALHRLTNPMRNTATQWGASNAEHARMKHLANNRLATGARLQNALARTRMRRELETGDLQKTVTGRNLARVLNRRSSYKGLDAEGHDVWSKRPNRSTQIAKKASLQDTITTAAQQNFSNTLSEYGDVFSDRKSKALGDAHGEAFLNVMRQGFRAENIAQGDQSFLLGRYLGAVTDQYRNPHEYNRLVKGASGKLGHAGETTIMGQVIKRSSEIEERRRAEARIMITKFGVNKSQFRGMILNKENVNDNGFEEDENGQVIEDSQYRYRDTNGNDTSHRHREWGQYIAVHKETGKEITKDVYNTLSVKEKANYDKIKYMEIKDDSGDVVQRIYEDDAGYMKEMLRKDIAIGDPINRRYATEIGLLQTSSEIDRLKLQYPDIDWDAATQKKKGDLRRYHSTISAALQESRYAEHAAEFTAMLTSQLDNGYVMSAGQRNIAGLDSLWKAAKTGKIILNDAIITKDWTKILNCVNSTTPGERFEDFFPDADILLARNVNGETLNGLRLSADEEGHLFWKKISRNDPGITLEDKKNWIKHMMIPEVSKKLYGSLNRHPSQEALNGAKPDGLNAFADLINVLGKLGIDNLSDDVPFEQRLNPDPDKDIFSGKDPNALQRLAMDYIREAANSIPGYTNDLLKSKRNPTGGATRNATASNNNTGNANNTGSTSANTSATDSTSTSGGTQRHTHSNKNNGGVDLFNHGLVETLYADSYTVDYETAVDAITDIFSNPSSLNQVISSVKNYFENHDPLSHLDNMAELERAIDEAQPETTRSTYDIIDNISTNKDEISAINDFYQYVIAIVNHAFNI